MMSNLLKYQFMYFLCVDCLPCKIYFNLNGTFRLNKANNYIKKSGVGFKKISALFEFEFNSMYQQSWDKGYKCHFWNINCKL